MEDLLKAIEYLGVPTTITVVLVGLFIVFQVIGEIIELSGKVAPEFLKVRKYFSRKNQEKIESQQMIKECKDLILEFNSHYDEDNITKRDAWIDKVNSSVESNTQFMKKLDGKIDKLLEENKSLKTQNEDLKDQLDQVKSNVLENEADRLRSELFDCGNRCRRHIRLHPEEMEHVRVVYDKYANVLHQNGPGEKEFIFITDYYNHQDFPAYHQRNDENTAK